MLRRLFLGLKGSFYGGAVVDQVQCELRDVGGLEEVGSGFFFYAVTRGSFF